MAAVATPVGRRDALHDVFRRRIALPTIGAFALALVVALASVFWLAREQNRAAEDSAARLVGKLVALRTEALGRIAVDYTQWDESFAALHEAFDPAWADTNVGEWLVGKYGVELSFLVGPDGRTAYASVDGVRTADGLRDRVRVGLEELLAASRAAEPADSLRSGLVMTTTGPAIAVMRTVQPMQRVADLPPGRRSTLIIVDPLDERLRDDLARGTDLVDLRLAGADAPAPRFALATAEGAPLAALVWRPDRPGDALAARLLPAIGLLGLALFAYASVSLRLVRRTASALATSEARAQRLALHDALTGLPNRALFAERLAAALEPHAADGDGPKPAVALLLLDLDGFKEVNDTQGHAAGDALLRSVAARLLGVVREGDLVARLGGDEFAVVQTGGTQPAAAEALARRLSAAVSEPVDLDGQHTQVGVSIGVALAPAHGRTPEDLAKHADLALYAAKADGRATFRFFAAEMHREVAARQRLLRELRAAVAAGGFEVHYQPQHRLCDGSLVGVEALIRWHHPELGSVPPSEFIPLAEETGLIIPLGEWVLRKACATVVAWGGLRLAVNLSAVQFRQADLVERVRAILGETRFPPSRLELEVTETAVLADPAKARTKMEELRALGVTIAMDDFGTGYSSLSQLSRLPIDTLKIDRSFVAELGDGGPADAIVGAILGLGDGLKVHVVAEGIEAEDQLRRLRELGCGDGQGYYFGKAVPAPELAARLPARARRPAAPAALGPTAAVPVPVA